MSEHWNRCDCCGKFFSLDDVYIGLAARKYYLDTEGNEQYETYCFRHIYLGDPQPKAIEWSKLQDPNSWQPTTNEKAD